MLNGTEPDLMALIDPEVLSRYEAAGIGAAEALGWVQVKAEPEAAARYKAIGWTPDDTQCCGNAAVAERWTRLGFGPGGAGAWELYHFTPDEGVVWDRAGWEPHEARRMMRIYGTSGGAAILWALTSLDPREAIERAQAMEDLLPFLPSGSLPFVRP